MVVSKSPSKPIPSNSPNIIGRRIIDIMHFITQIQQIDHKPFSCSFKDMLLESEQRFGFRSSYTFKCQMCNKKSVIQTENDKSGMTKINTTAVIGIIHSTYDKTN